MKKVPLEYDIVLGSRIHHDKLFLSGLTENVSHEDEIYPQIMHLKSNSVSILKQLYLLSIKYLHIYDSSLLNDLDNFELVFLDRGDGYNAISIFSSILDACGSAFIPTTTNKQHLLFNANEQLHAYIVGMSSNIIEVDSNPAELTISYSVSKYGDMLLKDLDPFTIYELGKEIPYDV